MGYENKMDYLGWGMTRQLGVGLWGPIVYPYGYNESPAVYFGQNGGRSMWFVPAFEYSFGWSF